MGFGVEKWKKWGKVEKSGEDLVVFRGVLGRGCRVWGGENGEKVEKVGKNGWFLEFWGEMWVKSRGVSEKWRFCIFGGESERFLKGNWWLIVFSGGWEDVLQILGGRWG